MAEESMREKIPSRPIQREDLVRIMILLKPKCDFLFFLLQVKKGEGAQAKQCPQRLPQDHMSFRNAILTDVSVKELEPQGLNFC